MKSTIAVAVAVVMILSLVMPAFAQTTTRVTIPRYTVIPVTLQQQLSSATNKVGDTFQVNCTGNCGGFPVGTIFYGRVTSVTKAGQGTPGQIEVRFYQALLPNSSHVPIDGTLTSLNRNDVTTDPNTGRLVQRPEVRNQKSKFLTYGAGLGLLIGILSDNALKGALIGALAGYLAGATIGEKTTYSDVVVQTGTQFGIALQQDITLVTSSGGGTGAGTGTGPVPVPAPVPGQVTPTWTVTFDQQTPYTTTSGVVMVPFRSVMNQIDQAFVYRPSNRSIAVNTANGQAIQHRVGTRIAYVDGRPVSLRASSRIINGVLYVPSDFVGVITGGNAVWQPNTGSLLIYQRTQ